ncbi:CobW family GTP-binding protein [Neoroseomonas soli]|uniref:GTP-binding protein n=1 Tax=Neoroseomonas soli TaxID=1081025 RepID=A0A9X9WW27_9PROT|nr:GTP-binding protein [Neoroseomonas soli]MBR0671356.1 GTP-binding protein [Neoroseomonas soli]
MRINAGLRVPLTVIGGFLGAGKTTLVNALLAEPGGARLAVLVNDFGAVNIDASLIVAREGDTIALSNGCVCCAMGDDLGRGIATILARRPTPEHIVVEASGVADPWRIAEIALIDPDLVLAGVVVLADASGITALLTDPLVGETARRQLQAADLLFLTKPDLAPAESIEAARAALAELAPKARLLTVSHGAVPPEVVLGETGADRRLGPSRPARHASLFETVTLRPSRPLAEAELRAALDRLPAPVLRAKGLLRMAGETGRAWLVQRVGRRTEIAPHPLPTGAAEALVLIGTAGTDAAAEAFRPLGLTPVQALQIPR